MEEAKEKRSHDIFFDLSFSEHMSTKELYSLASQLSRSLNAVKHSTNPFALHFSSYNGEIKKIMDGIGCINWTAYFYEEDLGELKDLPGTLLYLSPDAEEVLETFDEATSFVIGGLVDRTVTSCVSLNRAKSCGIKAVRLPLNEGTIKVAACSRLDEENRAQYQHRR